eukprot:CAMPEP_0178427824 /NCGR_PEP_ID=MMETSP0689_2-20121128/29946_1 /TAXON_ID=160604 /ORGANISM="Amphidinium massartii, Strain CS-259" /LENGTH=275 /DNA_ID=CAMNT_0020049547 /DNA_START=32 /DNA_END=859 /DNA_ORIENTATION=+
MSHRKAAACQEAMRQHAQPRRLRIAVVTALIVALCHICTLAFVGISHRGTTGRMRHTQRLQGKISVQRFLSTSFKELSRVEELIYDSCMLKHTAALEAQCLRVWDRLTSFHRKASVECDLSGIRCVMLTVLDRLCAGIHDIAGLDRLRSVSTALLAFRGQFVDAEAAFEAADVDRSGDIDPQELASLMDSIGCKLADDEVQIIFEAADADGDGIISKEEFLTFLAATVFAEAPLRELHPSEALAHLPGFEDYLHSRRAGVGMNGTRSSPSFFRDV